MLELFLGPLVMASALRLMTPVLFVARALKNLRF